MKTFLKYLGALLEVLLILAFVQRGRDLQQSRRDVAGWQACAMRHAIAERVAQRQAASDRAALLAQRNLMRATFYDSKINAALCDYHTLVTKGAVK